METDYAQSPMDLIENREKLEDALARLKSLKFRVSELRAQCETLKKLRSEARENLICQECGKPINQGQEVTLKDSFGKIKSFYHKDCFREIWQSQDWKFDYSYPGFLKLSEKDH